MTKFSIVRGGNVLGSNGSVVPHFIDQINRFNKITVTNEHMTRYFLTLPEAIALLFVAAEFDVSGGIFVMKMPSCRIIDLAKTIIAMKGNKNTKIEFMGIRQGEKLHEVLVSNYESPHTYEYGKDYYLIHNSELDLPNVKFKEYSSNDILMNGEQIKQLLERGGVHGQA
jgi:FlaA1/EpsC-like NDP-sugar epimerase